MVNHPNRSRQPTVIKLIRYDSGFANISDSFAVFDGEYIDDFEASLEEYVLPAGYRVHRTVAGDRAIFAAGDNRACELYGTSAGRPAVVGGGNTIVLEPAAAPADH